MLTLSRFITAPVVALLILSSLLWLRLSSEVSVFSVPYWPDIAEGPFNKSGVRESTTNTTSTASLDVRSLGSELSVKSAPSRPDIAEGPVNKSGVRESTTNTTTASLDVLSTVTAHLDDCEQLCLPTPPNKQLKEFARIGAKGGLTSRLRVVLSYLAIARRDRRRLVVHWVPDAACRARFSDLFEPIGPDIDFVYSRPRPSVVVTDFTHIELKTRSTHGPLGAMALALLRPVPSLLKQVDRLRRELGSGYLALHIRRTDKSSDYASDAGFAQWASERLKREGTQGTRMYVLTDNPRSLGTVHKALPSHAVVAQRGIFDAERVAAAASRDPRTRLTSVGAAVIDMWVASYAAEFKGTPRSSFSAMIESLRRARGLQHCEVVACVWC
jgi:hypothetical protein